MTHSLILSWPAMWRSRTKKNTTRAPLAGTSVPDRRVVQLLVGEAVLANADANNDCMFRGE